MADEYSNEAEYFRRQRALFRKYGVAEIRRTDVSRYAIQGLRRFYNIEYVTKRLMFLHSIPANRDYLARRQAESIRYCLQQFLEYYNASRFSPYSRPTLMYYALMYLATVEILWKLDGRYSLQRLRERHAHHGLEFSAAPQVSKVPDPTLLRCKLFKRGTFVVWSQIAKDGLLVGEYTDIELPGETTTGIASLFAPDDKAFNFVGTDLLELGASLPQCLERGTISRERAEFVRITAKRAMDKSRRVIRFDFTVHPASPSHLEKLYDKLLFRLGCVSDVNIREYSSGLWLSMEISQEADFRGIQLPGHVNMSRKYTLLRTNGIQLNEFGVVYAAAYIGGMFARYYPELWAKSVDSHDLLSQIVTDAMDAAEERGPLLLLGELQGIEYVLE